jgi:hypothetical protein
VGLGITSVILAVKVLRGGTCGCGRSDRAFCPMFREHGRIICGERGIFVPTKSGKRSTADGLGLLIDGLGARPLGGALESAAAEQGRTHQARAGQPAGYGRVSGDRDGVGLCSVVGILEDLAERDVEGSGDLEGGFE